MSQKKKAIRAAFRKAVFERDRYECKICGRKNIKLDAHHITSRDKMPNGGYVLENGVTLCDELGKYDNTSCHASCEARMDDPALVKWLYDSINSSYEKAYEASEKLQ